MPVSIFLEWYDHYLEEPWGHEIDVLHHAEICTYLVNGLYKPKNPVKMTDFLPASKQPVKKEQTWQEMKALLKGIADRA